jgi:hypothetical protein
VQLGQRHVLIQPVLDDGSRPVVELLIVHNPGDRTIVGRDSLAPTWETRLLAGALDVVAGESDLGHEAVHAHGDTLEVLAPLPPGAREIVVTYLLPAAGEVTIPVDQPVGELAIMVADTQAVVLRGDVVPGDVTTFEGDRYLRVDGADLAAGAHVVLGMSSRPRQAGDVWWVIVLGAALALAGSIAWWRRRGAAQPERLAAQIAALDQARAADPDWPDARRRMLATLAATLARVKPGS